MEWMQRVVGLIFRWRAQPAQLPPVSEGSIRLTLSAKEKKEIKRMVRANSRSSAHDIRATIGGRRVSK